MIIWIDLELSTRVHLFPLKTYLVWDTPFYDPGKLKLPFGALFLFSFPSITLPVIPPIKFPLSGCEKDKNIPRTNDMISKRIDIGHVFEQ